MPLARLNLTGKDVPSALMQVVNANVKNLVPIGQPMSMRLCFLSIPKKFSWPDANIEKGDTLDECLPKDAEYWLSILYETAFAMKSPLYHNGTVTIPETVTGTIHGKTQLPLHRLIYPLAPHQTVQIIIAFSALPVLPTTKTSPLFKPYLTLLHKMP